MSILKLASLVVTPNAYEESKLLAVVPSNGLGDLDFVRASAKTRVNPQGFIADACKNLVTHSSNLNNVNWDLNNATRTLNAGISPDGLNNAVKITRISSGLGDFRIIYNNLQVLNHTRSIYAKTVSGIGKTSLLSFHGNTNNLFNITNEWQRFELNSYINTGSDNFYGVDFRAAGNTLSEILIWAPQAELGSSATSYLPTTDRLNVPSIDYSGGGCPSILLEPQTTNLNTFSEDFTDVSYNKTRATISSNVTLSPDGNDTADKLIATTDNNNHQVSKTYSNTVGSKVSFSVFVKKSELIYCQLRIVDNATNNGGTLNAFNAHYDLQNGVITSTLESGIVNSLNPFSSIKSFNNNWYRCEIGFTKSSDQVRTDIAIFTSNIATAATNPVYVGNNVDGIFIFGLQLEERAATSYIPTLGSAVTRLQDQLIKTGISNLIGQTEGVFFIESAALVTNDGIRAVTLTDGTSNNRIQIRYEGFNNSIFFVFQSNGGFVTVLTRTVVDITQFLKIAIRYSANEVSIFIDGVKVITNNTIALPLNLNKLSFDIGTGTLQFNAKVNSLLLFKTYLSDNEMQLLGITSYNTYQEMATALNYVTQ